MVIPTLDLAAGSVVGIAGPSGAGKSSLLHALAGIEAPATGTVMWDDVALWTLPQGARDRWRRERLGLVFQDIHLIDGLSARDNVLLPLTFDHMRPPTEWRARADALLARLGIAQPGRATTVMSRGERQRVALARALLRNPSIVLADEPTASLDQAGGRAVGDLLLDAAAESGATLLIVTHDDALLARTTMHFRVVAGRLEQL